MPSSSDLDMVQPLIHRLQFMLTVCMLTCPAASGLFEWLRQTQPPPAAPPPSPAAAPLIEDAQFELATADEKFLAEAKQMELSPLDSCHYRVNMSSGALNFSFEGHITILMPFLFLLYNLHEPFKLLHMSSIYLNLCCCSSVSKGVS